MLQNPIFVALDVDAPAVALSFAKKLKGRVGGFKLGPRLLVKAGASLIAEIAECGPVFVDNKYYDIPSTMESAVRATFEAGASFCTIHTQSGREAIERLAELEQKLNQQRQFQILGVTILTSFADGALPGNLKPISIQEHVNLLADLNFSSGLTGLVCSPYEVSELKKKWPQNFYVTPGVRLEGVGQEDQKRVMTPAQAMASGASALVIGRPILQASDPIRFVEDLLKALP